MKFLDYFKASHDQEVADKQKTNNLDDYGSVDLYAPHCFNHGELVLIWQPVNKKMVQIWNNHVFVDGEEVGQFKYNFRKDVNGNYSKYLGLSDKKLRELGIQGKARYD